MRTVANVEARRVLSLALVCASCSLVQPARGQFLHANQDPDNPLLLVYKRGKVGFVDGGLNLVISAVYDEGSVSAGDVLIVREGQRWKALNTEGKAQFVLPEGWRFADSFRSGFAVVARACPNDRRRDEYNFVDRGGALLCRDWWEKAYGYSEGLAVVQSYRGFGYVDVRCMPAVTDGAEHAWPFSEGVGYVQRRGKVEFVRRDGSPAFSETFSDARPFKGGLAPVTVDGVNWGYVDSSGSFSIRPEFEDARNFSEGLAAVRRERLYGFIDRGGRLQVSFQYEQVGGFWNGFATARKAGKIGYISRSGALVIPFRFQQAGFFGRSGYSFVVEDEQSARRPSGPRSGYIDRAGKWVWVNSH